MVVERTASFGKLHLKGIVASVGLTAGLLVLIKSSFAECG